MEVLSTARSSLISIPADASPGGGYELTIDGSNIDDATSRVVYNFEVAAKAIPRVTVDAAYTNSLDLSIYDFALAKMRTKERKLKESEIT